jgi:hypothetical protein
MKFRKNLEIRENVNSDEIALSIRTYPHSAKEKNGKKYFTQSVLNDAKSSDHSL